MSTISEIIKAIEFYEKENKKLEELRDKTNLITNDLNLDEIKNTLNYFEAKEIYKLVKYRVDENKRKSMEKILKNKKEEEYPEILDVHYYPNIKEINFLGNDEKVRLDIAIKSFYKDLRPSIRYKLSNFDSKILDFLVEKRIIEKQYIFHCNCGSDECYDKIISQEEFDKLTEYWRKLEEGIETTELEDKSLDYGCFETGCWNDGTIEVCCLDDFNKHLRRIDYRVIQEPDMTLDDI